MANVYLPPFEPRLLLVKSCKQAVLLCMPQRIISAACCRQQCPHPCPEGGQAWQTSSKPVTICARLMHIPVQVSGGRGGKCTHKVPSIAAHMVLHAKPCISQ